MSRTWKVVVLIGTLMIVLSACGQTETEEDAYGEAEPADMEAGADPTVVDAAHYKAEFENDQVRILRIKYGPGEASVMHYHPDAVAVFLTAAMAEFELPDGTKQQMSVDAGTFEFTPAGDHLPTNMGGEPLEVILVELKDGAAAGAAEPGPDPTEVDAGHYKVEFENDRVRVLRIKYGPGETSVMHYHPNNIAVFLTDLDVKMKSPGGTEQEVMTAAGTHMFAPPEHHLPTNGEGPLEVILVELK